MFSSNFKQQEKSASLECDEYLLCGMLMNYSLFLVTNLVGCYGILQS
jgi:hypothetical protein